MVFNTERRANGGSNDHVDGHLYFRPGVVESGLTVTKQSVPTVFPPLGDLDDIPGDSGESAPTKTRDGL